MAFTVTDEKYGGQIIFSGNGLDGGDLPNRYMSISTEVNFNLFRDISIVKTNIAQNSLGLYQFARPDSRGEVKFGSFSTPKHLLQARSVACSWNPKGEIQLNSDKFTVDSFEYDGELCPDLAYKTAFRGIYGAGLEAENLMATPNGQALLASLIDLTYLGLGNSFYDALHYGGHPHIDLADTYDTNGESDQDWINYKGQQSVTKGLMTMVYDLKYKTGLENFNIPIYPADISEDGNYYIGTVTDLFDRVIRAQSREMEIIANQGSQNAPILLVTKQIFQKYEDELTQKFEGIPASMQYYMNSTFAVAVGSDPSAAVKGVLYYKGYPVVCMYEWADFDFMVGTKTFRAMLTTRGNFGVGYDVPSLEQFEGMGMRMVQRLDAPHKGKIYKHTIFDTGAGLLSTKHIVNASEVIVPSEWSA